MNSYLGLVLSFGFFTSAGGSLAVDPSLSPSLFTPPWQLGMIVLILLFMRTKVMSSGCSTHPGWRLLVRLSLHSPHLLSTTVPLLLPVNETIMIGGLPMAMLTKVICQGIQTAPLTFKSCIFEMMPPAQQHGDLHQPGVAVNSLH